jgi:hypothetical protein
MHAVYKALINGVQERGDGGVLWVKGEHCSYCFPDEFPNEEFAYGIRTLLNHDNASSLFFVLNETAGKVDVVAYERTKVAQEYEEELRRRADAS